MAKKKARFSSPTSSVKPGANVGRPTSSGPKQTTLGGAQSDADILRGLDKAGIHGPLAPPPATYDSGYYNDIALGQQQHDVGQAGINLQRGRIGFDTGFGADGQVDISNPYNQAMMLQRSYQQDQRGITNSMAAQGQLYSGARQRGLDESSFQYERNRSDLQTGAQRGYEDLSLQDKQLDTDQLGNQYAAANNQSQRWRDQEQDWYALYG